MKKEWAVGRGGGWECRCPSLGPFLLRTHVQRRPYAARCVRVCQQRGLTPYSAPKEFAEHEQLSAATGLAIYFAQPYAAWQRGTNEHTNGLVRQYAPKGTDFKATSHRAVAAIETSLNDRPRKRLGYRTPREVLQQYSQRRGVAIDV